MVQNFRQIRYYNDNSSNNSPQGLTSADLVRGDCFAPFLPASQIGISALPGTRFFLNGGSLPVIINFSGLFDLNLLESGSITSLSFDEKSLDYIKSNDSAYLLIDLVYRGGGN